MVTHTGRSSKFTGTVALRSVHGALAGVDSEHVDEAIPLCVSEGCSSTQPGGNPIVTRKTPV